jgi:hypothetical protein
MAEEALVHQKSMEETSLKADIRDVDQGRWYGLIALLALIGSALLCGLNGHTTLALAFLGTGALGTIGAFINGKVSKGK